MKKIKILNWLLIIFIALGIISIIGILCFLIYDFSYIEVIYSKSELGMTSFYIIIILTLMLLFGLYQVQQSLASFIKNSFFNSKSAKLLKRGGFILILNGILSGLHTLAFLSIFSEKRYFSNLTDDVMMIMIGIGLMAVSEIISKGASIEQENLLII